jgi:glutaredoxin-like YruB-family protein
MSTEEKNVVIYSTPTCHFCQLSKEFFKENGITYREFNVASDMEKRQEMVEKSGGMAVPVITIDDEVIIGFDKDRLSKALELAA